MGSRDLELESTSGTQAGYPADQSWYRTNRTGSFVERQYKFVVDAHLDHDHFQTRTNANQPAPDDARPPSFSSHWHPILLRTSAHITRNPTRPPNYGASPTIAFKLTYPANLYYYRPSGLVPKTALRHHYASELPLAERSCESYEWMLREKRPEVRNTVISDPELELLEILWNEPDKVVKKFIIENGIRPEI